MKGLWPVVVFKGGLILDSSKCHGTVTKLMDSSKLGEMGLRGVGGNLQVVPGKWCEAVVSQVSDSFVPSFCVLFDCYCIVI